MYKVLIVDDEPFILEGLDRVVKWAEYGLEIIGHASNGIEALKLIDNTKVDILLTDIKMPEMDGIELIKQVKKRELDIRFIILSGYDDFVYLKDAIKLGIENYLLKPVNEDELSSTLLNTIEKIESELQKKLKMQSDANILKDNILCRWVTGNISPSDLLERAELLNIDVSGDMFIVALLRLLDAKTTLDSHEVTNSQEKNLASIPIYNICNETIGDLCPNKAFCDLNGEIVIIFNVSKGAPGRSDIKRILNKCTENINNSLGIDIFITIGSSASGSMNVCNSYRAAHDLLEYRLIMPPNTVVDFESVRQQSLTSQKQIEIDFEKFRNFLLSQDRIGANSFMDDVYSRLSHSNEVTPAVIQNISVELLYNTLEIMNSMKIDSNELPNYSENNLSTILQIKTADELSGWIKLVVNSFFDISQSHVSDLNPLIKRVLDYIDAHLSEDLAIKMFSNLFKVNAAYLGQLFKKETGELFSNYLNNMRINKAKELLISTNSSAGEIALLVGYANNNYFFSQFKKLTGVYPAEYKRTAINHLRT